MERCGGRCEVLKKDGSRCRDKAVDVDHIQNNASGGSDALSNLQGICAWHHARKSAREGVDARAALNAMLYRKPETHPGIIPAAQAKPSTNRGF